MTTIADSEERVTLYKYLPAEYALQFAETRMLKVATLPEVNDPYEAEPVLAVFNGVKT